MRRLIIALGIVLLVAAIWFADLLVRAGTFRTLEAHALEDCRQIEGVAGAEDLTIDPQTGIAYLSADDRWAAASGAPRPGAIYAYNIAAGTEPVNLTPAADASFRPHGISLYRAADGTQSLFVINHGGGRQTVEIFDLVDGALAHRRTVEGPGLVSPNDLVAVGPQTFYVSNDHANAAGILRTLEDYLSLRQSTVFYFDGNTFTKVVTGVGGANGINLTADGRTLYLSAASEHRLKVFNRDQASGALAPVTEIPLEGFPDNIEFLPGGDLLVAIHSKIFSLLAHSRDESALSPSEIVRISGASDAYQTRTIYLNLGEEISGASTAAAHNGHLLVSPIFQRKFLDCRWTPSDTPAAQ